MFNITIYTDGACSGNPGPGGYAAILTGSPNGKEKPISGYVKETTNNRMELSAVIAGINELKTPCIVTVVTDSQYVCEGLGNARTWRNNNWTTKTGAKCQNADLWELLLHLEREGKHEIHWQKISGHSGHPFNERCDDLAKKAIKERRGLNG